MAAIRRAGTKRGPMSARPTPVHVISGALGAGKTTVLLHLLRHPLSDERVAVVVNDFGTSAIDEGRLGRSGVDIAEIRGACVCCTAPEGFMDAVGGLVARGDIDRILVEPTGLARPADLIDTLRRAPYADHVALQPLVVVVDPEGFDANDATQQLQLGVADVVAISKADLVSEDAVQRLEQHLAGLWPGPLRVHRIADGALPESALTWGEDAPRSPPASSGHAHLHHRVGSAVWGPDAIFHRTRLRQRLEGFTREGAVRIKGVFRTDEGWLRLEWASGRLHEAATGWRRDSRVDLIVEPGRCEPEAALQTLTAALVSDEERQVALGAVEVGLPDGRNVRVDRQGLLDLPGGVPDVSAMLPGRAGAAASVQALLDAVGTADATQAVVVAADGYTTPPVPLDALRSAVLIHSLDAQPLPSNKGGPYRLMIPGDAGPGGPCANVKGVVRIALR